MTTFTDQPLLMTVKEVCESLRIGRSTLYRLIAAKRIAVVHVGRSVRIRSDDVKALVSEFADDREQAP
jgi:excisionase family DNA binding protein